MTISLCNQKRTPRKEFRHGLECACACNLLFDWDHPNNPDNLQVDQVC